MSPRRIAAAACSRRRIGNSTRRNTTAPLASSISSITHGTENAIHLNSLSAARRCATESWNHW